MSLHDAYLRRTPYELAFPDMDGARSLFQDFEEEAGERGVDPVADPEGFVMLGAVGEAMRELRGPGEDAALIRQHGRLLWHAYRFWKAGEVAALLRVHALRYLVDAYDASGWDGKLLAPAGYLQLPQHLVWVRSGDEGPPQSLDGFFWAATASELFLLLASGMRDERPGLTVVPLGGLPLVDAEAWLGVEGRADGEDFASSMPGAEMEGLRELRTAAEAVKLAARALRHASLVGGEPQDPPRTRPEGPRPSVLPHRVLDLE